MKNALILAAIGGIYACSSPSNNQELKQVPEQVSTAFNAKFAQAEQVVWEQEDESTWEAEFKLGNKEYSANFSNTGKWLETEQEIESNQIPDSIWTKINAQFEIVELKEAELLETPSGKKLEVVLEEHEQEIELEFIMN